jgi:hypothetical protein
MPKDIILTFHFSAGEDLDPRWAGYRVEMVVLPFEILPLENIWHIALPPTGAHHVVLRWRLWKVGVPGYLQVWRSRSSAKVRYRLEDFDPERPAEVEEIRRLKREVETLRQERDILKKALGIFSRSQL